MEAIEAIVTYAKAWSMVDDKTGELKQGVSVEYILANSLDNCVNEDGSKGYQHSKESVNLDKAPKFTQVPGLYKMLYDFKPGSKGKIQLKLTDVEFLSALKLKVGWYYANTDIYNIADINNNTGRDS